MSKEAGERAVSIEVEAERRELGAIVEEVQAMFHRHCLAREGGAARLLDSLDELREHLGMMFALQETDGYRDEVAGASPLEPIDELKTEHATLFDGLTRMIDQCDQDVERGRWQRTWKLAEMTFENFCERLRGYEASEAAFMQHAVKQEIGAGR